MEIFDNYFKERSFKILDKTRKLQSELPFFCGEFFRGIENQTSPLTRYNYALDLKIFFNFLTTEILEFSNKSVKELNLNDMAILTSTHIEIFLDYLSAYHKDAKLYINNERGKARKLATIKSFLKYFYKKDKIPSNVASKVDTPKIHEKDIVRLEVDEVVKLLDQTENPQNFSKRQVSYNEKTRLRDSAILTLLLGTGIRVSECVGLNIEDFDFNVNGFRVTRKGGNQTILYFSDEVANVISNYLKERLSNRNVSENEKALFLSLQNKRITVRAIEKLVKKYSEACIALKHITPHKLRSTYGTNLYRQTKDIYIVADVLGHKDVNTTRKHYAAISEDARRSVANAIKLRDDKWLLIYYSTPPVLMSLNI